MIQANELRVGNWVMHEKDHYNLDPDIFKNEYVRVTDITHGEYFHWKCDANLEGGGRVVSGQKYTDSFGIPLTSEILEKAGFEKKEVLNITNYFKRGGTFYFSILYEPKGQAFVFDSPHYGKLYRFLHELQNLYFALTGEELEINL